MIHVLFNFPSCVHSRCEQYCDHSLLHTFQLQIKIHHLSFLGRAKNTSFLYINIGMQEGLVRKKSFLLLNIKRGCSSVKEYSSSNLEDVIQSEQTEPKPNSRGYVSEIRGDMCIVFLDPATFPASICWSPMFNSHLSTTWDRTDIKDVPEEEKAVDHQPEFDSSSDCGTRSNLSTKVQ